MTFDDSFFEDEVRDGFYVPGIMKRVWAQQLEILEDIKEACRQIGVSYYAGYGTMLGVKRHGGFVPWDDDIDLWMERNDYMKFMKYAGSFLPQNYEVRSVYSDREGFEDLMIWVVNAESVRLDEEFLSKYHGSPFRLGVDIFPLDQLPSKDDEEALCALSELVTAALSMADSDEVSVEEKEEVFALVEGYCGVSIDRQKSVRQQLARIRDMVHAGFASKENDEISDIRVWMPNHNFRIEKAWLRESAEESFEGTTIPVIGHGEELLHRLYGAWETKTFRVAFHDYPIYEEQEKLMEKKLQVRYGRYYPDTVARQRNTDLPGKEKWLFIPLSHQHWNTMEKYYEAAKTTGNRDVRVMPVPYYLKKLENAGWHTADQEGAVSEAFKSGEADSRMLKEIRHMDYPQSINVEDYREFDIGDFDPDVIVIQCPYDAMGSSITLEPKYYTKTLREKCKKLIYIPYFEVADFEERENTSVKNAVYYAVTPGVMLSDETVLSSQRMKDIYLNSAREFINEQDFGALAGKLVYDTII